MQWNHKPRVKVLCQLHPGILAGPMYRSSRVRSPHLEGAVCVPVCMSVCRNLVKTSASWFGTRSPAILKKQERRKEKSRSRDLGKCGLMPKVETHRLMVFCEHACVCICPCVVADACCHAYAWMGTHMDVEKKCSVNHLRLLLCSYYVIILKTQGAGCCAVFVCACACVDVWNSIVITHHQLGQTMPVSIWFEIPKKKRNLKTALLVLKKRVNEILNICI